MSTPAQSEAAGRPVAIFVMGVARSGTSALTRVLSLCGGTLPAGMQGADPGNPRGYWEPREVNFLNETILNRHGSAAADPTLRLLDESPFDGEEEAASIAKISAYFATLPVAPVVVIKDLRITSLSAMWFEAARQAGFDVAAVISVRRPPEVLASMAAFYRFSPELSTALWLKYSLLAERHTRGIPRVFVEYANLIEDWRREVKRISAGLAIDLNTHGEDEIEKFLTPDLRHQRQCGPVTEVFGTHWIAEVYEALSAAARDETLDESALDCIFDAYRASERGFRTAYEDFYGRFNSVQARLLRPSVIRLYGRVMAIAHRRKGSWA